MCILLQVRKHAANARCACGAINCQWHPKCSQQMRFATWETRNKCNKIFTAKCSTLHVRKGSGASLAHLLSIGQVNGLPYAWCMETGKKESKDQKFPLCKDVNVALGLLHTYAEACIFLQERRTPQGHAVNNCAEPWVPRCAVRPTDVLPELNWRLHVVTVSTYRSWAVVHRN